LLDYKIENNIPPEKLKEKEINEENFEIVEFFDENEKKNSLGNKLDSL
jgi:hypothetical protein